MCNFCEEKEDIDVDASEDINLWAKLRITTNEKEKYYRLSVFGLKHSISKMIKANYCMFCGNKLKIPK